jgi:hypothetical protein
MFLFSQKIPYRLKEGIFLEKENTLLPWNASIETLEHTAHPNCTENHRVKSLSWKNDTIFDGLQADIFCQSDYKSEFSIKMRDELQSANDTYQFILAEMTKRLGAPHTSTLNKELFGREYPRSQWRYGPVHVSIAIGERFMEFVSFIVYRGTRGTK